jgi:hypothetical protein
MWQFIHQFPFFTIMVIVLTAFMLATGIGWLHTIMSTWRLARPRRRRSRPPARPLWYIHTKWTAIQIYQKFIQWCHKK